MISLRTCSRVERPVVVGQELREDVPPRDLSAPRDDLPDDPIESASRRSIPEVARGGQPRGVGQEAVEPLDIPVHDRREALGHDRRPRAEAHPEDGPRCDRAGQGEHVLENVAFLADPPGRERLADRLQRDSGIVIEEPAVECLMDQRPARRPDLGLCGQQAVAEDARELAEQLVLPEQALPGDEDLLNPVWLGDQIGREVCQPQPDHPAVLAGTAFEEPEGIAHALQRVPDQEVTLDRRRFTHGVPSPRPRDDAGADRTSIPPPRTAGRWP